MHSRRRTLCLSGARPFTPRDLPGVVYWLDAGAIIGVADGGSIAAANLRDGSSAGRGPLASANAVTYRADGGTGRPGVEFDGSTSYTRSPSFAVAQPFRVFMVAKQITWSGGRRFIDGVTVNKAVINQSSLAPKLGLYAGSSATPLDDTLQFGNASLIEAKFDGASSSLQVDGNTMGLGSAGTNGYSDGVTLGAAGNLGAGFFANFTLMELVVADGTLTAAQAVQLRDHLSAKHRLVTQSVLVCDGDSLTAGLGATSGLDYPAVLQGALGGQRRWRLFNGGTSGQTIVNMSADAAATIDGQLRNYAKARLIFWGGTNDLQVDNVDLATLQSRWITYASARQSAGWTAANNRRFIAATLIARGNWTSGQRTIAGQFNTWLRSNYATYATDLLDLAADSRFGDAANLTMYQSDQVHLTDAGNAAVAALALPLVA